MKAAIKIIFFISICTFFSGIYFFEVQKRNISNQVEEIKSEMLENEKKLKMLRASWANVNHPEIIQDSLEKYLQGKNYMPLVIKDPQYLFEKFGETQLSDIVSINLPQILPQEQINLTGK